MPEVTSRASSGSEIVLRTGRRCRSCRYHTKYQYQQVPPSVEDVKVFEARKKNRPSGPNMRNVHGSTFRDLGHLRGIESFLGQQSMPGIKGCFC